MKVKLCDLQRKEVVSVKNGVKLGFADDVTIDTEEAQVRGLVVYGKLRLFGLLGRRPDVVIPWESIEVIGEDAILVNIEELPKETVRRSRWAELWNG